RLVREVVVQKHQAQRRIAELLHLGLEDRFLEARDQVLLRRGDDVDLDPRAGVLHQELEAAEQRFDPLERGVVERGVGRRAQRRRDRGGEERVAQRRRGLVLFRLVQGGGAGGEGAVVAAAAGERQQAGVAQRVGGRLRQVRLERRRLSFPGPQRKRLDG